MWKNGKLKLRHWVLTLFEVLVPTVLFIILVVLRAQVKEYDVQTNPPITFE